MNPERSLAELETMTAALDELLVAEKLFLPVEVAGEPLGRVTRATIAGFLERLALLEASPETAAHPEVTRARAAFEELGRRSATRLDARLARELNGHLSAWRFYVEGVDARDERCFVDYGLEVDVRLKAARLVERAGASAALDEVLEKIRVLDERLRAHFHPEDVPVRDDGFATDPRAHWWLYGRPRLADGSEPR